MRSRKNQFDDFSGGPGSGRRPSRRPPARGAALVITLILLTLLSAASLAIVLLVSSDTMINGYYRNYRGSFYAADSGVNVVVEALKNSVVAAANQNANPPLPIGAAVIPVLPQVWATAPGAYPAGMTTSYAPFQANYYMIGDVGSWRGQFKMVTVNALGTPQFQLQPNPIDSASCLPVTLVTCPNGKVNSHDYVWRFSYPYTLTIQGQSSGAEAEQITETGAINYTSTSGTPSAASPPSFAKWGAFINQFADCQGPLVPGTMTGPFFTNGQWNFSNSSNPGYTFTDTVGQVGANVSWWNNNKCTDSPTAPKGVKQPNFQSGLQLSQNQVTPPSDTYNQAQAVLDGKGIPPCTSAPCPADPPPSQVQMNQELKTISGTSFPSSGSAPTGVYIPYYTVTSGTGPGGKPCSNGNPCYYYGSNQSGTQVPAGGFYVEGNASITLQATTGCAAGCGASDPTQTYTIKQGSTTTTIVVDNTTGVTVVNGTVMQGAPQQLDPNTGQPIIQTDPSGNAVNPTLVYVDGQITGMSGTVQNNTGITVAADNNISITGDVTYVQSPVTVPSDTLNASTNAGVLGIYTTGNINLYPNSSGSNKGNLTVDASLAALSGQTNGTSGFATPGGNIGTWTILGGRSEDQAHSVSIGTGNTYYDRRFANNFGPPWFPTAVPQPGQNSFPSSSAITVTRTSWVENSRN